MDAYRERQVLKLAATSRAVVSLIAALTALIVTPYDTSTHLESRSNSLLSAFANWDGVYFAHIARHGYDYEHVHAFFPLYPMLMRALRFVQTCVCCMADGWLYADSAMAMVCASYKSRSAARALDGDDREWLDHQVRVPRFPSCELVRLDSLTDQLFLLVWNIKQWKFCIGCAVSLSTGTISTER